MDYPKRKGEGGILILVRLYVGSNQTLSLDMTIYTWELYVVITNIRRNKE
jgi:hypothetical protein